ncbi:hypothetical protein W911_10550 [Hyphomicrobium nitrativorans NL23]|uniref:Phosphodiester glycosidase domain-containing protein n=1 Tax=Hyphomicrobium nitrativorans NL23 TaxID=1029756 RepID=V5SFB6_9HYPH|nr:hypothetical protein [Hyphomicrobium nitrativorans]AHB48735.1 hypothetical protein W911_10550 [Hyphomicrobium nitrativorans NL23]
MLVSCTLLALVTAATATAADKPVLDAPSIPQSEIASPAGLPAIGKWMIAKDGSIAHWLGERVDGKKLHEPINVVLIDASSSSADEARKALVAAATAAGYPVRFGHSTGYRGYVGGALYHQLPQGRDDAFSNRVFEETNNHGRIFGPHASEHGFVFIGAFSREAVNFLRDPPHRYASFNQARDGFARALAEHSRYRQTGTVPLGNAIANNPEVTTGDHDGLAVVLRRD